MLKDGDCRSPHVSLFLRVIGWQVAEQCLSLGAQKALYISADMSSESDPDKALSFALDQLGGLDYLVLNHIGPSPFSMWDGDVEHIRWIMKVTGSTG